MDIFNKEKVKQLELDIKRLEAINTALDTRFSKVRTELSILTEELDSLQEKITEYEEAESKQLSFPTKKFNISKGVDLLLTSLSDKALAKFCHDFVEELGNKKHSHLISLNNYTLSKLTRSK